MQRPQIKSVFPPMPVSDRLIRIGGADHGLAAELHDDEHRHVWRLLQLLDGSRTRAEIIAAMVDHDATVRPEEVEDVLQALIDAGYVEDGAARAPVGLFADRELERYRRNLEFFSYFTAPPVTNYDLQARLKQARVTVLGLGGLGSYVALALAAAGVGDMLLVDDDTVELHNLNRQVLYTETDVGCRKTEAAARRLAAVNPHIQISTRATRVASIENAGDCLRGRDLLVCAADRPRIRIYEWLNAAAVAERVAWIRGANDGLTVNMFLHVPGETACFECEQRHALATVPSYGALMQYAMDVVGDRTVNPCTAPVAGLIGGITALEAVKYLSGAAPSVIHNRKLTVDLQTFETRFAEGHRQPDCSACGQLAA
jgi:molybdopterin/thiamine biosynthesis adenylyltransferase